MRPLVKSTNRTMDCGIITVEYATKWYSLWVVHPGGEVTELPFHDLGDVPNQSTYVDHCPNPSAVERYAELHGMYVDDMALELIAGRWVLDGNCYLPA